MWVTYTKLKNQYDCIKISKEKNVHEITLGTFLSYKYILL